MASQKEKGHEGRRRRTIVWERVKRIARKAARAAVPVGSTITVAISLYEFLGRHL
ncbi:hypothetical protein [Streptomyces sp. 8N616]|uniref:hypothetical protein n=1 Tax=Streptomyces sp. 8N616 TaxID=3457414 RepID=UPI003FD25708